MTRALSQCFAIHPSDVSRAWPVSRARFGPSGEPGADVHLTPSAPRRCGPSLSRHRVHGHSARQLQQFVSAQLAARATGRASSRRKSAPTRVTLTNPHPSPRRTRCLYIQTTRDLSASGRAIQAASFVCGQSPGDEHTTVDRPKAAGTARQTAASMTVINSFTPCIYVPECRGSPTDERRLSRLGQCSRLHPDDRPLAGSPRCLTPSR
jgi:hypothetical protein